MYRPCISLWHLCHESSDSWRGHGRTNVRTSVLTFGILIDILSLSPPAMRFAWDENKSRQNLRKHDVRFETAALGFDDPYSITQRDSAFDDEERWITVGAIGPGSVLLVVHTLHE